MKNAKKIRRTIEMSHINVTVVDKTTSRVSNTEVVLPGHCEDNKKTESKLTDILQRAGLVLVTIVEIQHLNRVYEMDVNDFIRHANAIDTAQDTEDNE